MDGTELDRTLDQHLARDFSGLVAVARGAEVTAHRHRGLPTDRRRSARARHPTSRVCPQWTVRPPGRSHHRAPPADHTSGITSYFEKDVDGETDPDYEALWRDRPVYRMRRPRDFLPMFTDKPMRFPPGERFEYCDGGFVLLDLVVEEVTGNTFTDHVHEAVLGPAGMVDSGYFPADQLPSLTALAYLPGPDGGWRTNVFAVPAIGGGDGGAYLTAPDLARMWRALVTYQLLSEPMTGHLLTAQAATGMDEPHGQYGLGVWLGGQTGDSGPLAFVEGADPGVCMISGYFLESEISVTILANVETPIWRTFKAITRRSPGLDDPAL